MGTEKAASGPAKAALTLLVIALLVGLPQMAGAETILRIGMTAADIPKTVGQPDQGFEGNRFTGLTMYDALTMWDLSSADKPSVLIPGLATEWKVGDPTRPNGPSSFAPASPSMTARRSMPTPWSGMSKRC
jgi:peptide/nickel transport system substrate-binding protein